MRSTLPSLCRRRQPSCPSNRYSEDQAIGATCPLALTRHGDPRLERRQADAGELDDERRARSTALLLAAINDGAERGARRERTPYEALGDPTDRGIDPLDRERHPLV